MLYNIKTDFYLILIFNFYRDRRKKVPQLARRKIILRYDFNFFLFLPSLQTLKFPSKTHMYKEDPLPQTFALTETNNTHCPANISR